MNEYEINHAQENEKIKKMQQDLMLEWTKNCKIKMKELELGFMKKVEGKLDQEIRSFKQFQTETEEYISKFSKELNFDLGSMEVKLQNSFKETFLRKEDFFSEVNKVIKKIKQLIL